jgi:transcriptional regulator with XRE-family HTH domain
MAMTLLRTQLGNTLRGHRLRQRRTLRDVSGAARVSLGYLSEVERGQKEASSELLASICDALDVELADLLAEVSTELRTAPRQPVRRMSSGERVVREAAVEVTREAMVEDAAVEPARPDTVAPSAGEPALALVGGGSAGRGTACRGGTVRLAA